MCGKVESASFKPKDDIGNAYKKSEAFSDDTANKRAFSFFTLQDLTSFTQYLVSLRVINPAGLGPETKVVVMTDEGGNDHYK